LIGTNWCSWYFVLAGVQIFYDIMALHISCHDYRRFISLPFSSLLLAGTLFSLHLALLHILVRLDRALKRPWQLLPSWALAGRRVKLVAPAFYTSSMTILWTDTLIRLFLVVFQHRRAVCAVSLISWFWYLSAYGPELLPQWLILRMQIIFLYIPFSPLNERCEHAICHPMDFYLEHYR
jgi:hypothetical protein